MTTPHPTTGPTEKTTGPTEKTTGIMIIMVITDHNTAPQVHNIQSPAHSF